MTGFIKGASAPPSPLSPLPFAFLLLLFTSTAIGQEAPPEEPATTQGERVTDTEVLCDVPFCDDLENLEALERLTGVWPGQAYDPKRLQRARTRLLKSGYFATVRVDETPERGGIAVSFVTEGLPLVHEIHYGETGDLFESDIEKRLFLRPGRPFSPRLSSLRGVDDIGALSRSELEELALEDQRQAIVRLYQREGFQDAKVEVTPEVYDDYLVDLHIHVTPGSPYALGTLYVRGHNALEYEEIENLIRSEFGFFSNFTTNQLNEGVDALIERYRKLGYIQVRLEKAHRIDRERKLFDVYLDITEGRHYQIHFEKNKALTDEELLATLTFFVSGFVDEAEIEASIIEMHQAYETAGHYWASIDYTASHEDDALSLTFVVDEGPRAEITKIVFDGATALSEEDLLDVIVSQPYQTFGSGAYPQLTLIADDAGLIVDAYQTLGYLHADVLGWELTPTESIHELELIFYVHEGEQTMINQTIVESPDQALIADTYDKLEVQPGTPFVPSTVNSDLSRLLKPFRKAGYARAEVSAACRAAAPQTRSSRKESPSSALEALRLGAELGSGGLDVVSCDPPQLPAGCFPTEPALLCKQHPHPSGGTQEICARHFEYVDNDPTMGRCVPGAGKLPRVNITYTISPGIQHFVGDFFLHGNFVTMDWVVHQDFPFDSEDPFDINELLKARSKLRARTIYESVTVETIGLEETLGREEDEGDIQDIPLVVHIEEGLRRWIDLALGTSYVVGEWLALAEAEFVEANLFGTGWDLRVLLLPEFRFLNTNGEVVLTQGFNQNWFSLLTFQVPLAPVAGIDLVFQTYYDLRYIPDTKREEQGALVELRWNLSRSWFSSLAFESKLSATSSLVDENTDYDACYPVTFLQECPFDERLLTFSIIPRTLYDARKNPLNPSSGYLLDLRTEISFSEDAGVILKPDIRASKYWRFLRNFTLAVNSRLGFSWVESGAPLPLFERFFLGGINIRGFEVDAVGPRRVDEESLSAPSNEAGGGEFLFNNNIEVRFPILQDTGIYGVVFWDMGTLLEDQITTYNDATSFFADALWYEMRHTFGLGLRWLIAENLPPLVLDYGVILDRRIGEPFGGLHFNVGYTF